MASKDKVAHRPDNEAEAAEAARIARIAAKAEMKAAAKLGKKFDGPVDLEEVAKSRTKDTSEVDRPVFLSKKDREQLALERLAQRRAEEEKRRQEIEMKRKEFTQHAQQSFQRQSYSDRDNRGGDRGRQRDYRDRDNRRDDRSKRRDQEVDPREQELKMIKDQYLGKKVSKKKVIKPSEKFAKIFQFDWEADEDTSQDVNPIYNRRLETNLLFGRGYRAGIDPREQRKNNTYMQALTYKRQEEFRKLDQSNSSLSREELDRREVERQRQMDEFRKHESEIYSALAEKEKQTIGKHWSEKSLEEMTIRDWRIFKEDFDIQVKGGRAPNPIRSWGEGHIHESILAAIRDMKYEKPSAIQMQCIPIGSQHRDIIGIAETGSGKTTAFTIPMLMYIIAKPTHYIDRTSEEGPLALVMAPTRELALQIREETEKLAKYTAAGTKGERIKSVAVVGGQDIEEQGFKLRKGVEIVIGTPGRLMETIESRYLVLNQASYVVLDEADRMIDMGFEPQVIAVLDHMGGLLKSENEEEAEQQIELANQGTATFRVTAMFSATMPPQVERLARTYLRHPVIVRIGDEESGKNKRIQQVLVWTTQGKKLQELLKLLHQSKARDDKVIVFVNIRKNCDVVAKKISSEGFYPTVLHGGRSQDQREEGLEGFRHGRYDVLIATDVASRGLDIPDVTHVINYDLPSKIEPYTHRIGRTGRAGKEGLATSLITDGDEDIMHDLKQHLQATGNTVPNQLASHPGSKAPRQAQLSR